MKLTFLGTRGEIEARTRRHYMHTALRLSHRGRDMMINCGLDWLGKFQRLRSNRSTDGNRSRNRPRRDNAGFATTA
jgi:hypothetical protein